MFCHSGGVADEFRFVALRAFARPPRLLVVVPYAEAECGGGHHADRPAVGHVVAARRRSPRWTNPHTRGEAYAPSGKRLPGGARPPRRWGEQMGLQGGEIGAWQTPTARGECSWIHRDQNHQPGRPPRMWGRIPQAWRKAGRHGETPTGVRGGLRCRGSRSRGRTTDPHACGEDSRQREQFAGGIDRPPRVWGRPQVEADHHQIRGQTPTRVGNALAHLWFWRSARRFCSLYMA